MTDDLADLVRDWPVDTVAAAVVGRGRGVIAATGDHRWSTRVASITKLVVAFAALVAVEEHTLDLDEPAGRQGATVRHLLSHAAGYDFDSPRMAADVGVRRVYSNVGFETFAAHFADAAGMPVGVYVKEAVLDPLGMASSELVGSPAHGLHSTVDDLVRFSGELLVPTLIAPVTHAEMATSQYPELGGVLPGFGRFEPNPWGIGAEIKGGKQPHWMGSATSPSTFGHFGGSGTMLWLDPEIGLGVVVLTDREFGSWAVEEWPAFSDAVVGRFGGTTPPRTHGFPK
jgi:CubicO group peptidase (beta-lactamase class C family)